MANDTEKDYGGITYIGADGTEKKFWQGVSEAGRNVANIELAKKNDAAVVQANFDAKNAVAESVTSGVALGVEKIAGAASKIANVEEYFSYTETATVGAKLEDLFTRYAESLKKINEAVELGLDNSCKSAAYGTRGSALRRSWDKNAATFSDFHANFESWSEMMMMAGQAFKNFEDAAATLGSNRTSAGTMDGIQTARSDERTAANEIANDSVMSSRQVSANAAAVNTRDNSAFVGKVKDAAIDASDSNRAVAAIAQANASVRNYTENKKAGENTYLSDEEIAGVASGAMASANAAAIIPDAKVPKASASGETTPVELRHGDVVNVGDKSYTYYGAVANPDNTYSDIVVDGEKLYYLDNNGNLAPAKISYYDGTGTQIIRDASVDDVGSVELMIDGVNIDMPTTLRIGDTSIYNPNNIVTDIVYNDGRSNIAPVLNGGAAVSGNTYLDNNTTIEYNDSDRLDSFVGHRSGDVVNDFNFVVADNVNVFDQNKNSGVVIEIPKGTSVQWDPGAFTVGRDIDTSNGSVYMTWVSDSNNADGGYYMKCDEYGNLSNSYDKFTLDGFNTDAGIFDTGLPLDGGHSDAVVFDTQLPLDGDHSDAVVFDTQLPLDGGHSDVMII